jgi:hypothetical protein
MQKLVAIPLQEAAPGGHQHHVFNGESGQEKQSSPAYPEIWEVTAEPVAEVGQSAQRQAIDDFDCYAGARA